MTELDSVTRCLFCGAGRVPFHPYQRSGFEAQRKEGIMLRCPDCLNEWTYWYDRREQAS